MLLEKYGVSEIYAKVTSKYAVAYLNDKNTVLTYDIKVDHIIIRLKRLFLMSITPMRAKN